MASADSAFQNQEKLGLAGRRCAKQVDAVSLAIGKPGLLPELVVFAMHINGLRVDSPGLGAGSCRG